MNVHEPEATRTRHRLTLLCRNPWNCHECMLDVPLGATGDAEMMNASAVER